jgi:L-malate glycosyltransferase
MQEEAQNPRPAVFLMTNTLETGGSERQFRLLADSLDRQLFRVDLGCIGPVGRFRKGLGEVAHVPPGGNLYGLQSWRSRITLAKRLRREQIAVAQAFDFYSNLMLVPAARLARVPAVIGSHRQLGDLLGPSRLMVQVAAFRFCDRVICNSHAAGRNLIRHGLPARKVVVIPNGLPEETFAQVAPLFPRQSGVLRVGMIARMNNPVKNYPGLLHAAVRVIAKFPRLEFLLVGDGPLRPDLEKMVQNLGLERQVRFLGDRHDVPAVLASLDVSVLPSFSESLSNTVLESMAAGVPVVATRVGGNSELVRDGETGHLVPPNDEIALAHALEHLLTNEPVRREWGKRAREVAHAEFSLARMTQEYQKLYTTLLARKSWKRHKARSRVSGADDRHRVRIAIVAPTLRYVGGQAVQADLLLKHWENDLRVHARFVPVDPEFSGALAWIQRIRFLRTLARMPSYWLGLWRGFRDVDIVHIFSASYWAFLLAPFPALVVARLRGKKVVVNYHSGEAQDHLSRSWTARPILRCADRRVVPSMYLANVFHDFGLDVDVVPNFVDLKQFRYHPRNPLRPRLLCSRGFGAYYSVDAVVRAFARIRGEFQHAELCLLGRGEQEIQVRQLVRNLRLDDHVHFPGNIGRDRIAQYYDDADIFVNASWLDNMPLSILEAFASGTPVASTAPEGIKYLVEHERTGLLSQPGDWEGLAENVLRFLRNPDFALSLAERAFQQSHRYSWEAVRERWLEVYGQLLENGVTAGKDMGKLSLPAVSRAAASEIPSVTALGELTRPSPLHSTPAQSPRDAET